MAKVLIEIDVINTHDIIKKKKGKFTHWFASLIYKEADLKKKVEEEICKEVVQSLKQNLDKGFQEEGITAKLRISTTL